MFENALKTVIFQNVMIFARNYFFCLNRVQPYVDGIAEFPSTLNMLILVRS